jgi:hypothetical protein
MGRIMVKVSRCIMWLVLSAVWLLTVCSIYAAFLGADKARQFFNSIPLIIYWFFLVLLFLSGFAVYDKLLRQPSSLLIHTGCLFILIGAMFGSDAGHLFAKQMFHVNKIPSGFMIIEEGQSENRVISKKEEILGQLSFSIKLNDFRIEYYDEEKKTDPLLNVVTADGKSLQIAAKAGEEITLEKPRGKLRVLRTFVNFKINKIDGKMVASDEPGTGQNPVAEVGFESSDGQKSQGYIFQRFADFQQPASGLHITYAPQMPRMPKDFFSDLVVIQDGKEILRKTIEVNYPLHFGGYHFYQYDFDHNAERYTVLSVTSDSGLYAVYGGYWLLCIGIIWRLWLTPVIKYFKGKKLNKAMV